MKLNGWQRLWLIADVVFAIVVVASLREDFTRVSFRLPHWFEGAATTFPQVAAYKDRLALCGPPPWAGHYMATCHEPLAKPDEDSVQAYEQMVDFARERETSARRREQAAIVVTGVIDCLGFAVSLYATGWLVGKLAAWVRRGFAPTA